MEEYRAESDTPKALEILTNLPLGAAGNIHPECGDAIYAYPSQTFYDDLTWAAAWLYTATSQEQYAADAAEFAAQHAQQEAAAMQRFNFDYGTFLADVPALLALIGVSAVWLGCDGGKCYMMQLVHLKPQDVSSDCFNKMRHEHVPYWGISSISGCQ